MKALILFLLAVTTCSIAQVVTVSIDDGSDPGNPLNNKGSYSIYRKVDGTILTTSEWYNLTVRNASSKAIVAFREKLDVRGGYTTYEINSDMLFGPKLLEPGAKLDYSTQPNSVSHQTSPPGAQFPTPTAEVTNRWVQFDDGTTFGDADYGKQLLDARRAALQVFNQLNQSYLNGGAEAFVRQLQQASIQANPYGRSLHDIQQQMGTDKAIEVLNMYLSAVESHKNLF